MKCGLYAKETVDTDQCSAWNKPSRTVPQWLMVCLSLPGGHRCWAHTRIFVDCTHCSLEESICTHHLSLTIHIHSGVLPNLTGSWSSLVSPRYLAQAPCSKSIRCDCPAGMLAAVATAAWHWQSDTSSIAKYESATAGTGKAGEWLAAMLLSLASIFYML